MPTSLGPLTALLCCTASMMSRPTVWISVPMSPPRSDLIEQRMAFVKSPTTPSKLADRSDVVTVIVNCELLQWKLNASKRTDVFDFGLVNPVTGDPLTFTNHQVAEAVYFTSLICTGQICWAVVTSHYGATSVLLRTNFVILSSSDAPNTFRTVALTKFRDRR